MVRFQGEQKIAFFTIISIYTEMIVFIFLTPFVGFLYSIIFLITSVPITLLGVKYYRLVMYKKVRDEIGSLRYWMGWVITKNGVWQYVDFPVDEKEEIDISDEELEDFEIRNEFNKRMEEFGTDNEEFADLVNSYERLDDQTVDRNIAYQYRPLGLTTSRQIYSFELIRAYYNIDDQKLKDVVKKISEMETVNIDSLEPFEQVTYAILLANESGSKIMRITEILEEFLSRLEISDRVAYNTEGYKRSLIKLQDVVYTARDPKEIKKETLKGSISVVLSVITAVLFMILLGYINAIINSIENGGYLSDDELIGMNVLFVIAITPILVSFVYSIIRSKNIRREASVPKSVQIVNEMSKQFETDAYCNIKKNLKQYSSNARIYKVYPSQKFSQIWPNTDYILVVMPASYEESLDFDIGYVSHRGINMDVQSTPFVMIDIGSMFDSIPMYLMIGCSYHFKRYTKIFYNYNLLQHWKEKVYLHIIATLQSKLNMLKPTKVVTERRLAMWQEWALTQAQNTQTDYAKKNNELLKVRRGLGPQGDDAEGGEESNEGEGEEPSPKPNRSEIKTRFMKIIQIGIFILLLLLVVFGVIVPLASNGITDPEAVNNSTTTETTTYILNTIKLAGGHNVFSR